MLNKFYISWPKSRTIDQAEIKFNNKKKQQNFNKKKQTQQNKKATLQNEQVKQHGDKKN